MELWAHLLDSLIAWIPEWSPTNLSAHCQFSRLQLSTKKSIAMKKKLNCLGYTVYMSGMKYYPVIQRISMNKPLCDPWVGRASFSVFCRVLTSEIVCDHWARPGLFWSGLEVWVCPRISRVHRHSPNISQGEDRARVKLYVRREFVSEVVRRDVF